jgi:pimeloyl-ACP methyl ester carboxylesterase
MNRVAARTPGNPASAEHRTKLKKFVYILFVIVCLWLLIGYLATMPVVGNHPFWRRIRATPRDFLLPAQNVSFYSRDGIRLAAWYIPTTGSSRATVVLVHGIDGNRSDMLPRALFLFRGHYNTLLVDFRAHGNSAGNYATPGYMEALDVLAAVSYLRNTRGYSGPIVLFGHSYGAVASLYAASESPDVTAIISDSAFISFDNMMKRATKLLAQDPDRSYWDRLGLRLAGSSITEWIVLPVYYLRTGVWPSNHKADVLYAIPHIGNRPILFIAGQKDRICPPLDATLMYDSALSPKKELLIIPNAEHDTTYASDRALYESTVLHFLQEAL